MNKNELKRNINNNLTYYINERKYESESVSAYRAEFIKNQINRLIDQLD